METEIIIASHAERLLVEIVCREAITPIIQAINKKRAKDNPIPLKFQTTDTRKGAKSNTQMFYAVSVNALPNWNGFYQTDTAAGLNRCSLDNIQEKGDEFASFLTHKPTGKYRLIQLPPDRDVLSLWCLISACFRTSRWRYEENRFVDPEARARVGRLIAFYEEKTHVMAGAGHAKKHDEDMSTALMSVSDAFQTRINDSFFPPYTYELPPLPPGVVLPISRVVKQIMAEV